MAKATRRDVDQRKQRERGVAEQITRPAGYNPQRAVERGRRQMTTKHSEREAAGHDDAPFFIIGAPRSGTSLLSRMLNGHPRLAVPFETTIVEVFHDMAPVYEPLEDMGNRRRLVADILDYPTVRDVRPKIGIEQAMEAIERDGIAGAMDGILAAWAGQQAKPRWGEKTPSNVFYFDNLAEWFPQAKFVHIIRDARDVARSLVTAPFGPKTLFTAAKRWEHHVHAGQEIGTALPNTRYFELRYEDLLDRPEAELQRICGFLGERYDPAMLAYFEEPTYYPTDPTNTRNLGRRVIKANSCKWRRTMARAEVEIVEATVAPTLRWLGYETVTDGRRIGAMEELYRTHLEPLPRRALSMLRNRRGHREALARFRLQAKRWRATLVKS